MEKVNIIKTKITHVLNFIKDKNVSSRVRAGRTCVFISILHLPLLLFSIFILNIGVYYFIVSSAFIFIILSLIFYKVWEKPKKIDFFPEA